MGVNLHADQGWAWAGSGARADQLGRWVDLSDDDTQEDSGLSLHKPHHRMLPPSTSIDSYWPLVGSRQVENLFFFTPQPPEVLSGHRNDSPNATPAGELTIVGRGTDGGPGGCTCKSSAWWEGNSRVATRGAC